MSVQFDEIRAANDAKDDVELERLCTAALANQEDFTTRQLGSILSLRAQALFRLRRFKDAAEARQQELDHLATTDAKPEFVLTVHLGKAWALFRAGQYPQAFIAAAPVYLSRESTLGPNDKQTLGALVLCVYALDATGHSAQVLPLAARLYEGRRETLGEDAAETQDAKKRLEKAKAASEGKAVGSWLDGVELDGAELAYESARVVTERILEALLG